MLLLGDKDDDDDDELQLRLILKIFYIDNHIDDNY